MDTEIILSVLIAYLTGVIAVGLYASKKVTAAPGFFLANRSLSWFPLTATLTATVVGGSATIATAALIYRSGLPGLWLDIGGAIGLIVLGFTLAKLVRKTGLYTLPEIAGRLFDSKVRYAAAVLIMIIQIAWVALLIQACGTVLSILLPVDYELLLILIAIIFIAYTFLGGQFAVVYTDILQFLIMIIGICCLAAPLLFLDAASLLPSISADHLSFPLNTGNGLVLVSSYFFMMLMPHIVGPDIYSKVLSAQDEKTAKYGAISAGVFKFVFAIAIGVIALAAVALVPGLPPGSSALALPMAITRLHPVFAGVILAAFVSVMLSSADSVLLSAGTVLSVDITRKKTIFISRIGILAVGILALLLSLYLLDIINTLKLAYTVFTAGLTLPIIFGFYKNKTNVTPTAALISLILGGSVSLIWLTLGNPFAIDAVLIGLIVSLVPLLVLREKSKKRE